MRQYLRGAIALLTLLFGGIAAADPYHAVLLPLPTDSSRGFATSIYTDDQGYSVISGYFVSSQGPYPRPCAWYGPSHTFVDLSPPGYFVQGVGYSAGPGGIVGGFLYADGLFGQSGNETHAL